MLAGHMGGRAARLVVDTSGPALHHLVEEPHKALFVLRMDGEEAEELAGRPLPTRKDSADFASTLVENGVAEMVIVARGADGSVLSARNGRWHSESPEVPVKSKVGAGDSFVGAFALALSRQLDPPSCLRWGVAAASAAVMTEATRLCDPEDVERILPACGISAV